MIHLSLLGPVYGREDIQWALDVLTEWNVRLLRRFPGRFPPLYQSGVRYVQERGVGRPNRPERWQTIPYLYEQRYGDCEDLATARAAELIVRGTDARAVVIRVDEGLWHVVVRYPDGRLEDPSERLGMPTLGTALRDVAAAPRSRVPGYTRGGFPMDRGAMTPTQREMVRRAQPGAFVGPRARHPGVSGEVSGRLGRGIRRGLGRADQALHLRRLARGGVQLAAGAFLGGTTRGITRAATRVARAASMARRAADELERNPASAAAARSAEAAEQHLCDVSHELLEADAGGMWA